MKEPKEGGIGQSRITLKTKLALFTINFVITDHVSKNGMSAFYAQAGSSVEAIPVPEH
jgi:hypothetical protein